MTPEEEDNLARIGLRYTASLVKSYRSKKRCSEACLEELESAAHIAITRAISRAEGENAERYLLRTLIREFHNRYVDYWRREKTRIGRTVPVDDTPIFSDYPSPETIAMFREAMEEGVVRPGPFDNAGMCRLRSRVPGHDRASPPRRQPPAPEKRYVRVRVDDEFGQLTVRSRRGTGSAGRPIWLCECRCGNFKSASSDNLRRGKTTHCGCSRTYTRRAACEQSAVG